MNLLANLYEAGRLYDMAKERQANGKYIEAESIYKQAIEMQQQACGAEDTGMVPMMTDLATLYCSMKQYSCAEQLLDKALTLVEKAYYGDHAYVSPILDGLVKAYIAQGKYVEAEPLAKRVVEICGKTLSAEHRFTLDSIMQLATIYNNLAKFADAEALLSKALKQVDTPLGPSEEFYFELAQLYKAQGKSAEAESALKKAIAGFEYRCKYVRLANCLESYSDFLTSTDRQSEALIVMSRAKVLREASAGAKEEATMFPSTLLRA